MNLTLRAKICKRPLPPYGVVKVNGGFIRKLDLKLFQEKKLRLELVKGLRVEVKVRRVGLQALHIFIPFESNGLRYQRFPHALGRKIVQKALKELRRNETKQRNFI